MTVRTVEGLAEEAGAVQFAEDGHDAAGAMHVFHVVLLRRRRHLGKAGHAARQAVDVVHGEIDAGLARGGEQVQHGVGRAAHGDVERHGVLEGVEGGDASAAGRGRRPARTSAGRVRRSAGRPCRNSSLRSACVASSEPLPGSERPSASVRQFIELAVNMPEQEPQVGQAERSIAVTSASEFLLSAASIMASMRSTMRWRRAIAPCPLPSARRKRTRPEC